MHNLHTLNTQSVMLAKAGIQSVQRNASSLAHLNPTELLDSRLRENDGFSGFGSA
jgi:hypothetical protein